jgi:hypothetical protein
MSESSFPFDATAEAEPLVDEVESGDSRRSLLVAGGLVGALVLGAGAFLLLTGGDDEELGSELPQAQPAAEAPAAQPQEVAVIPVASTETVGRNPFKARYIAPVDAPATGTSTDQPTTAATDVTPEQQAAVVRQSAPYVPPTPTSTTPPSSTAPAPAPGPAPTGTTAPVVVEPPKVPDDGMRYPVTLLSIDQKTADGTTQAVRWGFGEESFEVVPGKAFGRFQHLRVVKILEVTADRPAGVELQIGDGSAFFVGLGQTVYVL